MKNFNNFDNFEICINKKPVNLFTFNIFYEFTRIIFSKAINSASPTKYLTITKSL